MRYSIFSGVVGLLLLLSSMVALANDKTLSIREWVTRERDSIRYHLKSTWSGMIFPSEKYVTFRSSDGPEHNQEICANLQGFLDKKRAGGYEVAYLSQHTPLLDGCRDLGFRM